MNKEPFEYQQELLCHPPTTDPLMNYGLRYHSDCEAFDQRACTKRDSRGIAVPTTGREMQLVQENSKTTKTRLANELILAGLATPENANARMHAAIKMAGRAFEDQWTSNHH